MDQLVLGPGTGWGPHGLNSGDASPQVAGLAIAIDYKSVEASLGPRPLTLLGPLRVGYCGG